MSIVLVVLGKHFGFASVGGQFKQYGDDDAASAGAADDDYKDDDDDDNKHIYIDNDGDDYHHHAFGAVLENMIMLVMMRVIFKS